MSLEQVANTLEAHDQLFPEVLSLIKLMEAQRNGKRGRARTISGKKCIARIAEFDI